MIYLIQTTNGQPTTDMGRAVIESVLFEQWLHPDAAATITALKAEEPLTTLTNNMIPVGTIGWTEQVSSLPLLPDNIPPSLWSKELTGRDLFVVQGKPKLQELLQEHSQLFVKSNSHTKAYPADIITSIDQIPEDSSYFCSEVVNFTSEWRIFVYKDDIVDVRRYLGSWAEPLTATDIEKIRYILRKTAEVVSYPAYTIDIGRSNKDIFIIEIHKFIACGLYGFENYELIRKMARDAWRHHIQLNNRP